MKEINGSLCGEVFEADQGGLKKAMWLESLTATGEREKLSHTKPGERNDEHCRRITSKVKAAAKRRAAVAIRHLFLMQDMGPLPGARNDQERRRSGDS